MADELQVIQRVLELESDPDVWAATLHPDVEWTPLEEEGTASVGIESALGIRRRWLESWTDHGTTLIEDVLEGKDGFVAPARVTARGRTSGVEVDLVIYFHFKFRDGKIVYIYEHTDRDEALRAAGAT